MRKIILGLAPALVLLSASPAPAAAPEWRVSEVSGNVRLTENGRSRAAVRGALLASGATITTAAGARAVIVRGEEFVIVSPGSQLRVPVAAERDGVMQMIEDFGTAMFKITRKSTPHFGVKTPYLAAVVKGTTFTVTVGAEGSTVQVTEGAVEVSTNDGGARDLVTAGVIASVGAADLYQLRIEGDASKVIRSDKAPSAGVVTSKPIAYQGPATAVVQIAAPVTESFTSLKDVTNGLLQGSSSFDVAALDLQSRSANAARDAIAEPAKTPALASPPAIEVPAAPVPPVAEAPEPPKLNDGNNGGGNATGNPGAGNNGNGTDGRGNAGPETGAPAPVDSTPPSPSVVEPVAEAPAPAPVVIAQPIQPVEPTPAPVVVPVVEVVAPVAPVSEPIEPVLEPAPAPVVDPAPAPAPVIEPVVEIVDPVPVLEPVAVPVEPIVSQPVMEPTTEPAIEPEAPPSDGSEGDNSGSGNSGADNSGSGNSGSGSSGSGSGGSGPVPVIEPVVEPIVEPILEPVLEPLPVEEPALLPEPLPQPSVEPVVEPLEPLVQPVLEPVAPVLEPVDPVLELIEPVADPLVQPVEETDPGLCLLVICL